MTATAAKLPEGFTSTKDPIVFQNPASWYKAGEVGRMVQGTYLGRLEEDNFGKRNYRFTATAPGESLAKDGTLLAYEAGTTVVINESGNINAKMKDIEVGAEVIIDYEGQIVLKNGPRKGKSCNIFAVYVKAQQG